MEQFTPRERTVAELLMEGVGPRLIAKRLSISDRYTKHVLRFMYIKANIRWGVKHVRLAVKLTYERYPELRPTFVGPFD